METSEGGPQNLLSSLLGFLHALSGWFVLYLAVGGLIGFAVTRPYTVEPSCLPFGSVFGVIESACTNDAVNFFWSVTVGWPRLLIIFPALAIALFKAAASGVGWHWSIDAAWWVFCSIPLFLLVWAGTSYWWKRHRTVAMIATTTIVLEILTLGLMIE